MIEMLHDILLVAMPTSLVGLGCGAELALHYHYANKEDARIEFIAKLMS